MLKIFISLIMLFLGMGLNAGSIASFPDDLNNLVLVKESVVPGTDVKLPADTPLFLQDTVRTYNWMNDGKGTKLNIFVPRGKIEAYKNHGPYEDGLTAVAIYEESDIVFVTEHLAGEPLFGVYDRKGNDASDQHPTFNMAICEQCHTANKDICVNGTCATPVIDVFEIKKP